MIICFYFSLSSLSQAFADPQRKLECRFRPQDRFCKSVTADHTTSSSLVLKIIVKRSKSKDENVADDHVQIVRTSIVGKVRQVYSFRSENHHIIATRARLFSFA